MNKPWNNIKNPETDTHVDGNVVNDKVTFQISEGKIDTSINGVETSG